jgi:hypothetical protein
MSFYSQIIFVGNMQDIPEDPTGELDKLEKFVKKNLDICKWAALAVVVMEVSKSSSSTSIMQSYHLPYNDSLIGCVAYGCCWHSLKIWVRSVSRNLCSLTVRVQD